MKFITKFFRTVNHDVDSILSGFSKYAEQLEAAIHFHRLQADNARIAADYQLKVMEAAVEQSVRAASVAAKMKDLIS